jgi:hypothetical protein
MMKVVTAAALALIGRGTFDPARRSVANAQM